MRIRDIDGMKSKITDLDGFFDVYTDAEGNYRFNINSTIYLDVPKSRLMQFKLDHELFWTTISYRLYNTTRLWWLLMKLNNVRPDDIFKPVGEGESIYYMSTKDVNDYVVPVILGTDDGR